ncbi:MAG: glycosyltransferase family 2 protein [Clostridiales bacterium]|nr:glycosyltransferase family 2 protein [Clostridiales bacterium]
MGQEQILYVVIPCYNEEEVLKKTSKRLEEKLTSLIQNHRIGKESRVFFVDDGSKDDTWQMIKKLHQDSPLFSGICLTRNRGHQNALLAGLLTAKDKADIMISMDADLQDDVDAIDAMLDAYETGCDIVYGVRNNRDSDSFFKRNTAQLFYRLTNLLGGELVYNHADFRLMSRRAVKALEEYREVNLFLRGIVPMIGYKTTVVEYSRSPRAAGKSKYPLKKMVSFAMEGITSLSIKPMQVLTWLGVAVFTLSLFMLVYIFARHLTGHTVVGWSSVAVSVWAIGGLQLLGLGLIGEYIGKIYLEVKARPRYLIEENLEEE